MKTYLITGCAGFIGSNFVYYMLKKHDDILLVNLDKLTYAGNLENLKGVEGDKRHIFVQGDICDKELVTALFEKYDFDCVINFAAESHVDRSIANPEIFVQTNVMGTVNLLQRAKALIPLLVPLFVSAFRRADELATAMECRCYHGGEGRTKLHVLRYEARDYLTLAFYAALCAAMIALKKFF